MAAVRSYAFGTARSDGPQYIRGLRKSEGGTDGALCAGTAAQRFPKAGKYDTGERFRMSQKTDENLETLN